MDSGVLSLVLLAAIILLGLLRKANIGFLAFLTAYPLAKRYGITDGELFSLFNTSLFLTLLGICFLIGKAQQCGALTLAARKVVMRFSKYARLIPVVVFFASALLSAIGPGAIPVMSLMIPLAVTVTAGSGVPPLIMTAMAVLGASAGAASPVTSSGVVLYTLAAAEGYTGIEATTMASVFCCELIVAAALYLILGGHRIKGTIQVERSREPFTAEQKLCLGVIAAMILSTLLLGLNIGLSALGCSAVLILVSPQDSKGVLRELPWDTVIMICGVGLYIGVLDRLGGIRIVTGALSGILSPTNAAAITAAMAGMLSWVSSTTGVVLPTMVPMVPDLAEAMQHTVDPQTFLIAIMSTAMVAGISPLSVGGGISMASIQSGGGGGNFFVKLFLTSLLGMMILVLLFAVQGHFHFEPWR